MTFSTMLSTMSAGMLRTCGIFLITLALSLPLGFLVAFGRMSRWAPFAFINRSKKEHGKFLRGLGSFKPVRFIVKIYISIMRGTPLMLQLLVWYFGPFYLFGWSIRGYRFAAIVIGFVLAMALEKSRFPEKTGLRA